MQRCGDKKKEAEEERGVPLRLRQSHRHAVFRVRKSSSLPLLPLKFISAIRNIDGVTLTAMLGVTSDARDKRRRRASGWEAWQHRRSLRCRYIFSQVSCFSFSFLFFLVLTAGHVVSVRGFAEKKKNLSRGLLGWPRASARVRRGHGTQCRYWDCHWALHRIKSLNYYVLIRHEGCEGKKILEENYSNGFCRIYIK